MLPLHFLQSKKFTQLLFKDEKYELLGSNPEMGKRTRFLGMTVDVYVCENEPKVESVKGLHIVSWHKPKDKDVYENIKIPGWYGPFGKYLPSTNPIPFIDTNPDQYYKNWNKRKQDYKKVWSRQIANKEILPQPCDMQTFLKAYLESSLLKRVKKFNQEQMKNVVEVYKEKVLFYLFEEANSKKNVAGVCVIHEEELGQAIYQYGFSDKNYSHLGVGIIDWCIQYAKKNNLRLVNLTPINTFGHFSKSWRGFTQFKLFFHPTVIYFRQIYFKISYN